MTVEKLSRFSANTSPLTQNQQAPVIEGAKRSAQGQSVPGQNDEAVRIGSGIESAGSGEDNAAKVARLREQVAQGSYKPDTTKVAEALVRDLFA